VLAVLLILSVGYFSIDWLGGSGYLGAFIAGVIAGNMDALRLGMHSARERELRTFARAVSDVTVVLVFLSLGANLPFDTLADHAAPALVTLAALIAVARPLTVLVCLLPDQRARWRREELLFIAWTRETGVLPAALAGILVAEGIPHEEELVTVVSLAIRHPAGAIDDEAPPGAQPRPRGGRRLGLTCGLGPGARPRVERAVGEQPAECRVLTRLSHRYERVAPLDHMVRLRPRHRLGLAQDGDDRDAGPRTEAALRERLADPWARIRYDNPLDEQVAQSHLELFDDLGPLVGTPNDRSELACLIVVEAEHRTRLLVVRPAEVVDLAGPIVVEDDREPTTVSKAEAIFDADSRQARLS